ncbi:MAG: hypothetical protein CR986_05055 [Ignavibacteriae bacterium]|nr:MAG: hypothetical protein CR986_05055 [Ignavibacteriota bacterium]
MNKNKIIDYAIALTRIYLALFFLISGLNKINHLNEFAQSIENYRILPIGFVNIFAIIFPWLEVISGGLLLIGVFIKENSSIILGLLVIFTLAVASAYFRGININCGCSTTLVDQKVGLLKIIENIALLIVAFINFKLPDQILRLLKI